ncbi:unnamed protein product [Ranitomeya imitator]|uniref:SUI1 domain-containing protein n=1 Tax=Ranitomeya imitator TaxID=111125 RepID=A0ABN9MBM2_9NEOB|nr:unnamed protein product [Ranitomeya imitator]
MKVDANPTHDAYVASWKDRVPADRLELGVLEMASTATENSEPSHDCKGESRIPKVDGDYPLKYCEYMPDVTKCRQWLEKNFPNEFAKLTLGNSPKQETPGGRGQIKQKKKTVPQKVTIAKIPRAKKKYVTRVCGLATFEIDLKEAQRFFAQKFSCGASVDDDSIDDLGEVKK